MPFLFLFLHCCQNRTLTQSAAGISLVFFSYAVLWSGNLYKNKVGDASLNAILEGSSLGLVLVDIVAVVLVLSAAPLSASIVALVAGYTPPPENTPTRANC